MSDRAQALACETVREALSLCTAPGATLEPEVAAHLTRCADCQETWRALQAVATAGAAEPPPGDRVRALALQRIAALPQASQRPAWALALAACSGLFVLGVALWQAKEPPPRALTAALGTPASPTPPRAQLDDDDDSLDTLAELRVSAAPTPGNEGAMRVVHEGLDVAVAESADLALLDDDTTVDGLSELELRLLARIIEAQVWL